MNLETDLEANFFLTDCADTQIEKAGPTTAAVDCERDLTASLHPSPSLTESKSNRYRKAEKTSIVHKYHPVQCEWQPGESRLSWYLQKLKQKIICYSTLLYGKNKQTNKKEHIV